MITWTCRKCRQPANQEAVLYVDNEDVLRAEETGNLWDWTPAHWRVEHLACLPDPDGPNGYAIDTEAVSTVAELLWWSGHLMGKSWITATDWPDLIKTEGTYPDRKAA